MQQHRNRFHVAVSFSVVLAGLLWPGPSSSAAAPADPACWRELTFATGNRLASATTTLIYELHPRDAETPHLLAVPGERPLGPRGESIGMLRIALVAMRSHGTLDIWYDPLIDAVLQTRRIGQGKDSRLKTHRFLERGVWRVRRAADGEARRADAEHWAMRSQGLLSYPDNADVTRTPVIAPEMLLARIARLAATPGTRKATYQVFGDKLLFSVTATVTETELIDATVQFESAGAKRTLEGPRPARRVRLDARPLPGQAEEDEFTLFELGGELSVYIDVETALPLGVQGYWMGMGSIPISLQRARLAADCNG